MGLNSFGLDAFYICAQEKNFTRAAERLHITQSALSQRIKNLEDEMGVTLFIRDRLGVRLTGHGEALLRYCHTREQLEQELMGEVGASGREITGALRIGGYSTVMRSVVLPACRSIASQHGKVQIQLFSRELFELPELLKNATVDFVLLDEKLEREGIKSLLLGFELNLRVRKKGTEFTGYYLDHDERDETTRKYLRLKSGAKLKRHFLDDIYGIIDGVRGGLGDAIVPRHLIDGMKDIETIDEKQILRNPVYLHYYDQPVLPRAQLTCIEELRTAAGKILEKE